jgi:hypothetical protein
MTKILSYNLVDYAVKSQLTKGDNIRGIQRNGCVNFEILLKIVFIGSYSGRSQWPRGVRHEISSPAQTLGS